MGYGRFLNEEEEKIRGVFCNLGQNWKSKKILISLTLKIMFKELLSGSQYPLIKNIVRR